MVNIVGRTDSKKLESAIESNNDVSDGRLRIGLLAIKEAIEVGDVEEVVWTDSKKLESVIGSNTGMSNRRLRIGLLVIKEAIEVGKVVWI